MNKPRQSLLIVDDNSINIQTLNEMLNSLYTIFFATSGLDALNIAEQEHPDLILLDIMMPEMDGYEVCRRLKLNPITLDIPVIFVTAMAEMEDETKGLEQGAVDYITKPVSGPIVKARVKSHLRLVRKTYEANKAYSELKASQSQLLQQEKMVSIGQLADGIAHELNTPSQYIIANIDFLLEAFADIITLIGKQTHLLGTIKNKQPLAEMIEEVRGFAEDIGISYLSDEIPKALTQSRQGILRIQEIVTAMKEFSYSGAEKMSLVDLNRVIRSTVEVSRSLWQTNAELDMELDEDLPMVPIIPGEFNQVILSLIVNAVQAIDETTSDNTGKGIISIRSRQTTDGVEISIMDSGIGIEKENISRIFEPFFTTKEVGKGAGLGLSITYDIVTKHHGTCDVESEVGRGTRFIIQLPVKIVPVAT